MQAEASDVAPRGVYKALYFVKGKAVLVAIDSKGDARKHLKIERGDDEPKLKRALEEFLDLVDPLPGPKLVREDRSGPGWPYDGSPPPRSERPLIQNRRRRR